MAEEQPRERWTAPEGWPAEPTNTVDEGGDAVPFETPAPTTGTGAISASGDGNFAADMPAAPEIQRQEDSGPMLFQNYEVAEVPERIPHLGHLLLLGVILVFGALCSELLVLAALKHHMFGIMSIEKATSDIHYTLGSEVVLYVFTLLASLLIFPLVWQKGFFAGIQWNAATAFRLRWRLVSAALSCLVLAAMSSFVAPGPTNAPIDKIFRAPGAAWLLFVFGVTFAPFFEEMFFRGFLLPTLCTAADWADECLFGRPDSNLTRGTRLAFSIFVMVLVCCAIVGVPISAAYAFKTHKWHLLVGVMLVGLILFAILRAVRPASADATIRPLAANGHPQWSFQAIAVGSIVTSIPFAMMHGEQTGYSIGPFVLLAGVSTVLCAVRLATRSLASSTLVHACYNFVLFSIMLVGTQGFSHLDKI